MGRKQAVIKIGADVKEAKNGINQVSSELNKIAKEIKKSPISKLATSFTAVTASVSAVTAGVKKVVDALNECDEAYKVQEKAEKNLQNAAKNNPYLNDESVIRLKNFASELQNVSEVGDETSINLMAQLASTGRTESEIMQIMAAATDYAAGANISLDTAVQNLNKTYSGSAGVLGKQIFDIQKLTKEQLQNGEAIDLVAQKYKNAAKSMADLGVQVENAKGDFKEAIGALVAPANDIFDNLKLEGLKKLTDGVNAFSSYLDKVSEGAKILAESADKVNASGESILKIYSKEELDLAKAHLELKNELSAEQQQNLILINEEINLRQRLAKEEQKEAEAQAKKDREKLEKEKETQKAKEESSKVMDEISKKSKALATSEIDLIREEIEAYKKLYQTLSPEDQLKVREDYVKGIIALDKKLTDAQKEESEKRKQDELSSITQTFENVQGYIENLNGIFENINAAIENNLNRELETLQNQLDAKVISEEEYNEKKNALEKQAAEKTYAINMAMWGIQMAQAAANTALAIVQTLGDASIPSTAGRIAMAAIIGALGVAQEVAIGMNKPVKPSFATGGIVQGSSYSGDRIQANVNSGEMILNARQQANLWKAANVNGGNGGINVNIQNSAANVVDANASFDGKALNIAIDARVMSQASKGKYAGAISAGSAISKNGIMYGL